MQEVRGSNPLSSTRFIFAPTHQDAYSRVWMDDRKFEVGLMTRRQMLMRTAVALLLTACGTSGTTAPSTTAPPATTTSASTTTAPTGTTTSEAVFTSPLYGYSIVLPADWTPDPAIERWDGEVGGFGSSTANSDAFEGTMIDNTLWAAAAPTTKGLNDFVLDENAIDAIDHDCENPPDIDEPITIDDEPARLTAKNCPIGSKTLIASAAVIKDGVGYFFYFRNIDPDSSALDVFRELLTGVTLP